MTGAIFEWKGRGLMGPKIAYLSHNLGAGEAWRGGAESEIREEATSIGDFSPHENHGNQPEATPGIPRGFKGFKGGECG